MADDFFPYTTVKQDDYTAFVDDAGIEIFRYNHTQTALVLTPEEERHSTMLCLQARIRGGWRGDILHPETYNVTEANHDAIPRILPEQGQ